MMSFYKIKVFENLRKIKFKLNMNIHVHVNVTVV